MKKIFLATCLMFLFPSSLIFASTPVKDITLNIQFDSIPNKPFYDKPLHINKTIKFDSTQKKNNIVMTQSNIANNSPVTIAMSVKLAELISNSAALQFNLTQYGFNQGGNIITQPKMILKNHQTGEMEFGPYKLKVLASWID